MLKTKCILTQPIDDDWERISVMSRHTLSDGKTLDTRITKDVFDEHLLWLAPNPKLVWAYYRWEIDREEYKKQYLLFLENKNQQELLKTLISKALIQNITLLCIEESPENCHRKLIALKCQELNENLKVEIK